MNDPSHEAQRLLGLTQQISPLFVRIPDHEVFAEVLDVVQREFESPVGLFGYFNRQGELVVPSLTRKLTGAEQGRRGGEGTVLLSQKMLARHLGEIKEPLLINGPLDMADGHVPIHRAMVAPLTQSGELIGLLSVANKADDYQESELRLLEIVASQLVPMLRAWLSRQREMEELLARDELLRALTAHIHDVITITDAEGIIRYASPNVTSRFGWAPKALIGSCLLDRVHRDDVEGVREVAEAMTGSPGETFSTEYRLRCADGRYRFVEATGVNMLAHDEIKGHLVSYRDVTRRHETNEALRRSEAELREAQSVAKLGSWSWLPSSNQVSWSDEMCRIYGISPGEEIPSVALMSRSVEPAVREQVLAINGQLMAGGPPGELAFWLTRSGGDRLWVRATFNAERGGGGSLRRLFGTIQDLTAQKLADDERRRFELRVQQSQKLESLGLLAGGIAHDFNNLLTGILGHSELVRLQLDDGSKLRVRVDDIIKATQRASKLSQQMLAYSGRGTLRESLIDLNGLVTEMLQLLRSSVSKRANIVTSLSNEISPLRGDAAQIQQIVMNLITNASEALEEGEGAIRISTGLRTCDRDFLRSTFLDEDQAPGDYVFLQVTDTGCGMDRETIGRIFDPFFSTKFTGRGLGLAAALGIVRGHKGAIHVESEPGSGTTIRVLFPVATSLAAQRSGVAESSSWAGSGRVLLVDDEAFVRDVAGMMLEQLGFMVETAVDGVDGVERFAQEPEGFDLVVLDLTMPRLGGQEALVELRRLSPGVKVLLCSGYGELPSKEQPRDLGFDGFLPKPFTLKSLRDALRDLFEEL